MVARVTKQVFLLIPVALLFILPFAAPQPLVIGASSVMLVLALLWWIGDAPRAQRLLHMTMAAALYVLYGALVIGMVAR